jgi:hypothetical protein
MARVTEGLFQGVHGKLGNVVFKRVNGKTFLCKSPVFRKRKPTERERITRMKFAFMIQFMKPLMFLIRRTYKHPVGGKSGFNLAFSHNYHQMMTGECPPFQVNYPKIILSRGSLLLPEMILAASLLPGTISFIWTCDNLFYQNNIKAFIAIYCEELDVWKFDVDNANLTDSMHTMELPDFKGKPVHTYIGFISANGNKVSDSHYTGMVNIL